MISAAAPVWVRDSYAILQRWCAMGIQPSDLSRLDEIRTAFDAASPSFARFIAKGVNASGSEEAGAQSRGELGGASNKVERLKKEQADAEEARDRLAQNLDELNEANLRMSAEIAHLSSALRQRQEEAAQAWKQVEVEQQLRLRVEAEQERLTKLNVELIAQFSVIDERVRADSRALADARRRASDAETAKGQMARRYEKLLADLEVRGAELQRALSHSARADGELAQLAKLLISAQRQVRALEEDASNQARGFLEDRHSESLAIKEMMAKQAAQVEAIERRSKWLQEATIVLQKKPKLRALLSSKARRKYNSDLLKTSGLFDPDSYLEKNPDVAESGDDPLLHFVCHGLREGRMW
jgi:chromosome segregation ATPase